MSTFNFTPFPVLETEKLNLRQLQMSDDKEIFILRSDIRVQQYIDRPTAVSIDDARAFIDKINKAIPENKLLVWAIELKGQTRLIGAMYLMNFSEQANSAELGYELLPDYHGKGVIQEAVAKIIGFAFHALKLSSLGAHILPGNIRSIKVVERNGFVYRETKDNVLIYTLTNK